MSMPAGFTVLIPARMASSRLPDKPLADIAGLLALWQNPQRSNTVVKQVAQQHLAEVELKLQELHAMKQTLQQMIALCAADGGAHCAILQQLANSAAEAN